MSTVFVKKFILVFLIWILGGFVLLIAACGPTDPIPKAPKHSPVEGDSRDLSAGTTFLNAPANWVTFKDVISEQLQTRNIYFHAKSDGVLVLSRGATGLGAGCFSGKENDFNLEFAFRIRSTNGNFRTEPDRGEHLTAINLSAGDSVEILLYLTTHMRCHWLRLQMTATFN